MSKNFAVPDLSKLQPLTGPNYRRWSEELMFFFQELGLDYVLFDDQPVNMDVALSTPPPPTTPATPPAVDKDKQSSSSLVPQAVWSSSLGKAKPEGSFEDHNRTCRGHIIRHLSEKLFDIYVNYNSAKEIWKNLKKRYGAEDEGKKQYITSKWTSFQLKDDQPILDQLHEYEAIVSKIQAEGIPIDEHLAAFVLIDKLPPSWNDYRSKLKHDKRRMSLDELIADLMIEDANRKYSSKPDASRSLSINANVVEKFSGGKNRYQPHKNKGKEHAAKPSVEFKKKPKCWNCNKIGHKKQDCRLPPQLKETNKSQSNLTEDLIAVTTEVNAAVDVVEWIVDSGSTRHICSQKSLFKTLNESKHDNVYLGDASSLQVAGIGDVALKLSSGRVLTLTKVLFVPNMRRNLISSALLMKAGFKQTFDAGKLVITKNGAYVAKAFCTGNLFVLDIMNEKNDDASAYIVCAFDKWHGRLGHLNVNSIKRLRNAGLIVDNLEKDISKCEICVEAKHARKPFPSPVHRTSDLLELIHSDLADFKSTASRGGKHYYITFVDDFSKYTRVYLLRSKDEASEMFLQFKIEVENQLGRKIKRLRSDRGGEYESDFLRSLCLKEGIIHERTAPYAPQQNGVAERKNRTLKNMMNAMLLSSGLPDQMWGEAVLSACHILNRVPHKGINVTPYELWKGYVPNLNYLRVWGCLAKVGLPSFKRTNIGPKTVDAVFVGYAHNSAAYRCLTFKSDSLQFDSMIESRDVEFFENVFPFKRKIEYSSGDTLSKRLIDEVSDEPRRSKRMRTEYDFGPDFLTTFLTECDEISQEFMHAYLIEEDPKSFSEAMKSVDAIFWKEAINNEIDSIMSNHTWELVDLPRGCKPIRCKWILKKKFKADGSIDKFKARLVAQGFSQKQGVDYFDTYAPVTRIATIRILLAVASIHNLVVHQMDVKTAFLNGDLHEEIYMLQPEGFIVPGQEQKVCRLIKSLYGLKQAPKQWFKKFDDTMHANGFVSNYGDTCVYSRVRESEYVIICLYVDDMLILGTSLGIVCETKTFLNSKFDMKDLGEADVILGMKIVKSGSNFAVNQSHYVEKILKKFGFWDAPKVKSPYDSSLHLCKNNGGAVKQSEYAKIMGSVMYLMNCTRPDIAYAVSRLSRYTHNPNSDHWLALTRLMHYLKGTVDWNLFYSGFPCVIEAYCDANWVSDNDEVNSTSGYLFTLGGGAVAWKSSKQTCIARSTMESELIAIELAGQEADWLRNLLADIPVIGRPSPAISMRCDSQAAIAVAMNAVYNGKKRHIRMRHKVIRSLIETGAISLEFVRSGRNLADPLTKGLCGRMVLDTSKEMGLKPLSNCNRSGYPTKN